jgi:hypothetical protein
LNNKTKQPEVLAYGLQYPKLTLKVQKEHADDYKLCLMKFILDEYNKGFIFTRINKATKKGTNCRFKKINDWKEAKNILLRLSEKMNINIKFEKDDNYYKAE